MLSAALKKLRHPDVLLLIGVLLVILGAKFFLIQHYGADLPFWDQWDAEGDQLYLSDARGSLSVGSFFAPHNEHRIFFTRLLAFGLEKINGQWDARLEMTVNTFIALAAIGLFLTVVRRGVRPVSWRIACIGALILFGLPLAWENTLGGFQSQFYFLLFFSIAHIGGTFGTTEKSWRWWAAQVTGLCAIFSMGSGFLSAAAVIALLLFKIARDRRCSSTVLQLLVFNSALVLFALLIRVQHPEHDVLKSHSLVDFVAGLSTVLAWPSPYAITSVLSVVAFLFVFYRQIRKASFNQSDSTILALSVWWGLQIFATVFARGGSGTLLSPRYFDLFSVGVILLASIWSELASSAANGSQKITLRILQIGWLTIILFGVRTQGLTALNTFLNPLPILNQHRIDTVRDYVQKQSSSFYDAKPFFELPYPNAERLAGLLREPGISSILPVSVRPGIAMTIDSSATKGFSEDSPAPAHGPIGYQLFTSEPRTQTASASFQSEWISRPHFHFLSFMVKGFSQSESDALWLETAYDRKRLVFPEGAGQTWSPLIVESPAESFRIVASSGAGRSLAFTQPVEMPAISWLSLRLLRLGPGLIMLGFIILIVGGMTLFSQRNEV